MFLCLSSDQSVCLGEACVTRALGMCVRHTKRRGCIYSAVAVAVQGVPLRMCDGEVWHWLLVNVPNLRRKQFSRSVPSRVGSGRR
jgi:hypothetical protein